ncbi:ABC transporter permease subunit [Aliikangiella marina]|uniref:ABC transporter permease subunit n=1 Tax=Aliikangiella marina TaxID=1712262 RepID=A0A545TDX7_9GAMM|nr:ABC transporter permease subunit [Aliikangiella marina]TQV75427.1 ABC transporter permease subunit [Aliikangiella marina]
MTSIIFRQFLLLILGLFTLTLFTFGISQLFPDPLILSDAHAKTINDSLIENYFNYIAFLSQGEWGLSRISGRSVLDEFFIYFPATLELTTIAIIFALVLGLPLGIYAAENKNKWQDKLIVSTTLIGYSMPIFWWGMLLVLLFALTLGISPVASRIGFEYDILPVTGFMLIDTLLSDQPYALAAFQNALQHLVLPTIVLGTIPLAIFTRVTRSAMIDALSSDYIRTAKAKGLPYDRIIWSHALRNAMIPIVTVIGLQISVLITGTLITEKIFAWPGIGKWLLEAVYRRDLVTLHGGLLAIASLVIIVNIAVEVLVHLVNPKLRHKK